MRSGRFAPHQCTRQVWPLEVADGALARVQHPRTILVEDAREALIGTPVRLQMPLEATLLGEREGGRQDIIDQQAIIVHWDCTKEDLENIGESLAETVWIGLG